MRATFIALFLIAAGSLAATSVTEAQAARGLDAPSGPAERLPAAPTAYHPTSEAPPRPRAEGYMPEFALLVPGAIAFVNTYGGAVLAGLQLDVRFGSSSELTGWLYVPVVGPFVLVGFADGVPGAQAAFFTLGLFQTAGLAFLIAGLAHNRQAGPREQPDVAIAPFATPTASGLSVAGRF